MTRVSIIGGGMAGCAAALAASRAGAEAILATRAPGATALYAGGMELCGDLSDLAGREPHHPFTRLGQEPERLAAAMDAACLALRQSLEDAGLSIRGDWRTRGRYMDLNGAVRPAHLVPDSVAPGELGRLAGRQVAVVGICQVSEYDAPAIAQALIGEAGAIAEPVELDLELPAAASLTDLFGRPAPRVERQADLVAYPPGMRDLPEGGFELLAAVPSPHGWRLQQALEAMLARTGVRLLRQAVVEFETEGRRVRAAGGIEADQFILATGRYIGGGLVKAGMVREPLFDLGVFYEGKRVDDAYPARLHRLEYLSPEPAFRTGLRTDSALRPVSWDGQVPYDNLRAAGSVLGGYDYARDYGFGVPLLTGWLAGQWAAA
jgi:glycerol-3-phosphate dehydrogenase subunit B